MKAHLLRRASWVMALFSLLLLLGCATQRDGRERHPLPSDEAAIRSTLDALNAACAQRDVHAFMELFADSDDIVFAGSDKGEVYQGKKATAAFMQGLFNLPFVFSFDLKGLVQRQDGDVAWIFADGNMVHSGDRGTAAGKMSIKPYRFSVMLVNRDGRWKWLLFHGSVPG